MVKSFLRRYSFDPLKGPGDELKRAADEAIRQFKLSMELDGLPAGQLWRPSCKRLEAATTRYKCLISHAGQASLESQWGTSDTIFSRN
jgi:hypothetical protein